MGRTGGNRAVESPENQKPVSRPSPRAWKSLARFPHSHRFGDESPSFRTSERNTCALRAPARKVLLDGVGLGYNYGSPAAPMAGFEVTTYGRFWGDHRGRDDQLWRFSTQSYRRGGQSSTNSKRKR